MSALGILCSISSRAVKPHMGPTGQSGETTHRTLPDVSCTKKSDLWSSTSFSVSPGAPSLHGAEQHGFLRANSYQRALRKTDATDPFSAFRVSGAFPPFGSTRTLSNASTSPAARCPQRGLGKLRISFPSTN